MGMDTERDGDNRLLAIPVERIGFIGIRLSSLLTGIITWRSPAANLTAGICGAFTYELRLISYPA
jgi:hypothetical protein